MRKFWYFCARFELHTFMKKKFRNYKAYALVTGAASGMGRIYSLRLAEKGYNVILVDINAKGLEETESMIKAAIESSEKISAEHKAAFKVMPLVQAF